ncbi:protein of unknown function [Methanocaldococcus lauensis]|uniref:Uncharacterized protein n=1 Tax=Methanocaldococcus lauensis TaxID=2546128 RepID=A0A8D6PT75_9EURY|nr:class III signal peptide-containing protein [Methanocaldococcus lauensis]CAB3289493.1 protein of unknown function [Methanocaldococcus lauensis]
MKRGQLTLEFLMLILAVVIGGAIIATQIGGINFNSKDVENIKKLTIVSFTPSNTTLNVNFNLSATTTHINNTTNNTTTNNNTNNNETDTNINIPGRIDDLFLHVKGYALLTKNYISGGNWVSGEINKKINNKEIVKYNANGTVGGNITINKGGELLFGNIYEISSLYLKMDDHNAGETYINVPKVDKISADTLEGRLLNISSSYIGNFEVTGKEGIKTKKLLFINSYIDDFYAYSIEKSYGTYINIELYKTEIDNIKVDKDIKCNMEVINSKIEGNIEARDIYGNYEFINSSVGNIKTNRYIKGDIKLVNSKINNIEAKKGINNKFMIFNNSDIENIKTDGNIKSENMKIINSKINNIETGGSFKGLVEFSNSLVENIKIKNNINAKMTFKNTNVSGNIEANNIYNNFKFIDSTVENIKIKHNIKYNMDIINSKINNIEAGTIYANVYIHNSIIDTISANTMKNNKIVIDSSSISSLKMGSYSYKMGLIKNTTIKEIIIDNTYKCNKYNYLTIDNSSVDKIYINKYNNNGLINNSIVKEITINEYKSKNNNKLFIKNSRIDKISVNKWGKHSQIEIIESYIEGKYYKHAIMDNSGIHNI